MRSILMVMLLGAASPTAVAGEGHPGAYPDVRAGGTMLFTGEEIRDGRKAWTDAARGSRDWTADWRQRETLEARRFRAEALYGQPYEALEPAERRAVDGLVAIDMRRDTYDAAANVIVLSPERAAAIVEAERHYHFLFGNAPGYEPLRRQYGLPPNALPEPRKRKSLAAWLFWSAWSTPESVPKE